MSIFAKSKEIPYIILHQDIVELSRRQIADSPRAETGGKFVGYVISHNSKVPESPYGRSISSVWAQLASSQGSLLLAGSISPGPRAERTAASLIPDGDFQARVFQSLVAEEPSLEHLGSWHSHHPNGLGEFSSGDVAHYRSVIADRNYEPDYFVAALCHGGWCLDRGIVELYQRRGIERVPLDAMHVSVVGSFPSLQPLVEHIERDADSGSAFPLGAALARAFVVKERRIESDAVSWVIEGRSGQGLVGVVTQPKGAPSHVAVSVNCRSETATLKFDGSSGGDVKTLVSRLLDFLREVQRAEAGAQKRRL